MGFDFSGLNDAVIDTFGETCTITTNTGSHVVDVVYFAPYQGVGVGGVTVDRADTTLHVKTEDISDISLNRRDEVSIRGEDWYLISVASDEEGITELTIGGKY